MENIFLNALLTANPNDLSWDCIKGQAYSPQYKHNMRDWTATVRVGHSYASTR